VVRRGELYRVAHPSARDPKRSRVFCIVSRQVLIDSKYSTVICAPVYTAYDGLATQVPLGVEDGMKHECSIHCDNLVSLQKSVLTNFIATLFAEKVAAMDQALAVALDLPTTPSI
jgi:mRNA interferase MazF